MGTVNQRFTATTLRTLEKAGWFPGRDVGDQVERWKTALRRDGFEILTVAEEVLREFGGLTVTQRGEGLTAARESFVFDPMVAHLEDDRFTANARLLGRPLYPLGRKGDGFLAIAQDGRVFVLADELWQLGENIDDALEALIQGVRGRLLGTAPWDTP